MGAAFLDHPPQKGTLRTVLSGLATSVALVFMAACSSGGGSGPAPVPAPTVPVVTAPANVTAGATGLAASTTAQANCTFSWTITNGTITAGASSTAVTFTAGATGTVQLSCVATNSAGVSSAAGTKSCTIVAAPVLPVITAPANVAPGATGLTASVPAQAGCTYAWTITNGTIDAGATTASITYTAGTTGTTDLGCVVTNAAGTASAKGVASSTIVTMTLVQPVISAPAAATAGATGLTASVPPQAGATFAWTITGGTITAGAATTSVTFTAGATGTVELACVATNGVGASTTPGTATVTIVAAPTTPVITVASKVTAGTTGLTASVAAQAGSTYAWTLTGGTITAGATTNAITFTAGASGTVGLSCVVTNGAGTASAPGTASSTIYAAPTTPVITVASKVTAGTAGLTASVPTQAGSTYAWTLTGGTITAGAATNAITFTAGASGTVGLSCVVTNGAGLASTAGTATSTIYAAPTTPVITVADKVTAGTAGLTASVPAQAGSTYAWTLTGGTITAGDATDTITFTAGASGTVGLSCVVTNGAGTASTPGTATSTIFAAPTTPAITVADKVTAGATGLTASVPPQAGSTYAWTLTGGTVTAGDATDAITFTAGASGTVGLSCVVTNGAGLASTPGIATSTIFAVPTTPVITVSDKVTAGATGLTASVPTQASSTYAWTLTGGTITDGATTDAITFTAGASGTVGLSCVVTNGAGTASTPGTASSTIVSAPTTPVITVAPYVTTVSTGNAASVPPQADSTYAWTITGGTFTAGDTTAAPTFTADASGTVHLTCIVTNLAGTPSTAGTADSTIVPVATQPTITVVSYVTQNKVGGYTATVTDQGNNSTYLWTINGNGTLTSGDTTPTLTFMPTTVGTVTLTCTVTNAAGLAATAGTQDTTCVAAPAVTSFAPGAAIIGTGAATTLNAVFTGSGATVTGGAFTDAAITSGAPLATGNLASTTTYTLTVSNEAGDTTPATAKVLVGSLEAFSGIPSGQGNTEGAYPDARFWEPNGMVLAPSGNIYVSDYDNNTIRMINAGGVVSTPYGVAGTHGTTDAKDTDARFFGPSGLAVDGTGVLYVADAWNQTIRKIDTGGNVSTIAGTPGTAGSGPMLFNFSTNNVPVGIALRGTDLYVADHLNNAIRIVPTGGGLISTLTLTGAVTTLDWPTGLVYDSSNDVLYVTNKGDHSIIGIDPTSGNTLVVADAFTNPVGLALSLDNNTLYVSDYEDSLIKAVDLANPDLLTNTTVIAGVAGSTGSNDNATGTLARFLYPTALMMDGAGVLNVADFGNNTIRTVNTTAPHAVATIHGVPGGAAHRNRTAPMEVAQYNSPRGIAVDYAHNIAFVAETSGNYIRAIDLATGLTGDVASLGSGASPNGIAVSADGTQIYFSETGHNLIKVVTYNLGDVTDPGSFSAPVILAGSGATGSDNNATGTLATFNKPMGLAVDGTGNVYVADQGNHLIRMISSASGNEVTTIGGQAGIGSFTNGDSTVSTFNNPTGLALSGTNLFVADQSNNAIRQIALGPNTVSTFAGQATPGSGDGNGINASFLNPNALSVDGAGNLFVADTYNNTVRMITPAGDVTTIVGIAGMMKNVLSSTPLSATLAFPVGIAVPASLGTMYIVVPDAIMKVAF